MSGIFGLWNTNGRPPEAGRLLRAASALEHRGWEAPTLWLGSSIGLGHCPLSVTREAAVEEQPLVFAAGTCVLTADARIDNREELIRELPATREATDADLIAGAYERWGRAFPEHLIGDFAVAIWNARLGELVCARDPIGVKPFYYSFVANRQFGFASELGGVLRLPGVGRAHDEHAVKAYLSRDVADDERTFYASVRRLPAATTMVVTRNATRSHRYWAPDPSRRLEISDSEEYVAAFRELFDEAVRARTRSMFRVGVCLSGGLDSSSIACTARDQFTERPGWRLHAFSAVFDELPEPDRVRADESRWIEKVIEAGHIESHLVHAGALDPMADIAEIVAQEGEPPLAVNLHLHRALCSLAARRDVRVLLDGLGGENTVSFGLERLDELIGRADWEILGREVRAAADLHGRPPAGLLRQTAGDAVGRLARTGHVYAWSTAVRAISRGADVPMRRLAWPLGLRPLLPTRGVLPDLRNGSRAGGPIPLLRQTFVEELTAEVGTRRNGRVDSATRDGRLLHCELVQTPLYPYMLAIADRAASRAGLEMRYPFFDRRLIDFCVATPSAEKLKDGWTRSLLRRAMAGRVPDDVLRRRGKQDLTPAYVRALRRAGPQRLAELVPTDSEMFRYVDPHSFRKVSERFFAGSCPEHEGDDGYSLFQAAALAAWFGTRSPVRERRWDSSPSGSAPPSWRHARVRGRPGSEIVDSFGPSATSPGVQHDG